MSSPARGSSVAATVPPSRTRAWLLASRPRTLPAAIAPVLVGLGVAIGEHLFEPLVAVAVLAVALLLQILSNLANDLFDFRSGADTAERLGPPRAAALGWLSERELVTGMGVVIGLAGLVGLYLVRRRRLAHPGAGAVGHRLRPGLHGRARGRTAIAGWVRSSCSSSSGWWRWPARRICRPVPWSPWPWPPRSRSGRSSRPSSWSTTCATSTRTDAPASARWRSGWGNGEPLPSSSCCWSWPTSRRSSCCWPGSRRPCCWPCFRRRWRSRSWLRCGPGVIHGASTRSWRARHDCPWRSHCCWRFGLALPGLT